MSRRGPNDAQSADQLDIGYLQAMQRLPRPLITLLISYRHHVFTIALDGKLFLAPLGDHPQVSTQQLDVLLETSNIMRLHNLTISQKILDVGTGTGTHPRSS